MIRIRPFPVTETNLPSPNFTCVRNESSKNLQTAPSDHTYDSCNLYQNTKSDCLVFHLMWLSFVLHDPLHLVRDYYLLEHNWQHDYHLLICTHLQNGRVYGSYNTPHLIYYKCLLVLRDHVFRAAKSYLNLECDWNQCCFAQRLHGIHLICQGKNFIYIDINRLCGFHL